MIEAVEGDDDAAFVRFRERVFDAAQHSIEHYSAPLVVEEDGKAIEYRSGVLIQIADMKFLVTAAHWLIAHHQAGRALCIVMPQKGMSPVKLVAEKFWSTKDPAEDISVTRLTDGVAAYLGDHYRFIRLNEMMSRHDESQGTGLYLIYGFPLALVGPDETGDNKVGSWRYLTVKYRGDYANVENYDPHLQLVLDYERRTHNRESQKVHPPGMSGCGIWFVGTPYTHPLFNENDFRLVGIQTAWHKQYEYAKGTWIDDVLLILWKYYPETHKPMMISGIRFPGV